MKRQQVTEYQLDLFSVVGEDSVCPYVNSEVVNEAIPLKASQVKEAGEQKRALVQREVKQLKETAVCESMHGGVRGRGSNPPTYSIV